MNLKVCGLYELSSCAKMKYPLLQEGLSSSNIVKFHPYGGSDSGDKTQAINVLTPAISAGIY